MVKVKQVLLVTLMVSIIPFNGRAQASRSLTLDEAIRVGLENSKVLRQSQSRVEYADAKAGEVNAGRLPSLKVAGSYTRLSQVPPFVVDIPGFLGSAPTSFVLSPSILNNYNLRASVQHPLFTGFKLDAASDAADYSVQAAALDYNRDRADLTYNIKSAYWGLYRAIEFEKVADENVEAIKSHVSNVKSLLEQGMATNNDILTAEVRMSDAQLKQISARNGVRLAKVALNNTLGIPLSTEVTLATAITHDPRTFAPLDSLIQEAMSARPELQAMNARLKSSEAGVRAAKSGWWPQVYLTGNYYYARPNQRILPTTDLFRDTWDVGVSVSLDIWNWGTTLRQVDQAEAQLEQGREAYGQLQDGVSLEITQSYLNLSQAREQIAVAKRGVEQAEENYRVSNRRFKEGLVLNSDMLDATVAVAQAKVTYTQALVDYELAESNLERAIGMSHLEEKK